MTPSPFPARVSAWRPGLVLAALFVAPCFVAPYPARAEDGDPALGRAIVQDRALSACLLCHAGPFPAPHLQGTIGPRLDGVGARLTREAIRQRLTDPARINPDTVMPSYGRTQGLNRVGAAWRGKPILTERQIEDVVAFLATLRGP